MYSLKIKMLKESKTDANFVFLVEKELLISYFLVIFFWEVP
jgi:hypothetical protein